MPFDIATALRAFTGPAFSPTHSPNLLDHRSVQQIQDERVHARVEKWLNGIMPTDTDAIDTNELSRHASVMSSHAGMPIEYPTLSTIASTRPATPRAESALVGVDPRGSFVRQYPYVSMVGIGIGGFALGAIGAWAMRKAAMRLARLQVAQNSLAVARVAEPAIAGAAANVSGALKPLALGMVATKLPATGAVTGAVKASLSAPFQRLASFFTKSYTASVRLAAPAPPPAIPSAVSPAVQAPVPFAKLGIPEFALPKPPTTSLLHFPAHPSISKRAPYGIDMSIFRSQHPSAPVNGSYESRSFSPFASMVHRSACINNGYIPPTQHRRIPEIDCTPLIDDPDKEDAPPYRKIDQINPSGWVYDITLLDPLGMDYRGTWSDRWIRITRTRQLGSEGEGEMEQVKRGKMKNRSAVDKLPFEVVEETWVTTAPVRRQTDQAYYSEYIQVQIHNRQLVCEALKTGGPYGYRVRAEMKDGINPIEVPEWRKGRAHEHPDVLYPLGDASKRLPSVPTVSHTSIKDIAIGTEHDKWDGRIEYVKDESNKNRPTQRHWELSPDQHAPAVWRDAVHIHRQSEPDDIDMICMSDVNDGRWGIEILRMEKPDHDFAEARVRIFNYRVAGVKVSGRDFACKMELTEPPRVHVYEFDTCVDIDVDTDEPIGITIGLHKFQIKAGERGWVLCDPEFDDEALHMRYA